MFSLVLALGLLASAPLSPVAYSPSVSQVLCDEGKGTAFRIGPNTLLSVDHVTSLSNCTVKGEKIAVSYADGRKDFSILTTSFSLAPSLKVSCEGFKNNRRYWAIGYARGLPFQRVMELRASSEATRMFGMVTGGDYSVLTGPETVIPGMSGGPIVDERGRVVGTVNAYNPYTGLSFSRSLRDTPICNRKIKWQTTYQLGTSAA